MPAAHFSEQSIQRRLGLNSFTSAGLVDEREFSHSIRLDFLVRAPSGLTLLALTHPRRTGSSMRRARVSFDLLSFGQDDRAQFGRLLRRTFH